MSTENIKQPKFDQDDQLDIMAALLFIQLNRRFSPLPVLDSPITSSGERRMLSILNWIAMFFVRDPIGDCIATALSVEDSRITLYLAANRGRPQDEDVKNGNKLISVLCRAVRDPQTAQLALFKSAISITYLRLSRKFDMITNMRFPPRNDDPTLLIETFEILITKWVKVNGVEQSQDLINYAQKFNGSTPLATYDSGEGINALKVLFKVFVEWTETWRRLIGHSGEEGQLWKTAWVLCSTASYLVYSDFFSKVVPKDVENVKPFDPEEYSWLRKLRRRLWRIARYWIDAGSVATTGIEWIKRILGNNELTEGGDGFRVVWVGLDTGTLPENHGVRYAIPGRPEDRFKTLLERFGFEESSQTNQPSFKTELGNLWPKPKQGLNPTITPFLRCELQLISYLDRHNILVHMNLIGVSKLMCWACNTYIEEVNKHREVDRKKPYVLSGTSGKAHNAWLIPPGGLHDVVVTSIHNALRDAISSLAQRLGHCRIHSGGSDSSTGSRDRSSPVEFSISKPQWEGVFEEIIYRHHQGA